MAIDVAVTAEQSSTTPETIQDITTTTCCVVGGGPAGAVLALLLARQGVPVLLLEAHKDFDRDFRGDTIHPSVMELMDELGLADRLLELPHTKIRHATIETTSGPFTPMDLRRLNTRFGYIMMLPQVKFLEFITAEAKRYSCFQLVMGARVEALVEENGIVQGVRYRDDTGWHEVRARLTVGADGRFSRLRRLAHLQPISASPPMDVLWFRLPREAGDPEDAMGRFSKGHMLVLLNRYDSWQVAYLIPKGSYKDLHAAGLDALRGAIVEMMPNFADRVAALQDWKQVSLLSVEADRLPRWYVPGLLLIGDAAHVMSPVAGVGINYAIHDAVVAANVLGAPLREGRLRMRHLRTVQRRRELPTRIIQAFQAFVQQRVIASALDTSKPFQIPAFVRLLTRIPVIRDLPARFIGFGIGRVHVAH